LDLGRNPQENQNRVEEENQNRVEEENQSHAEESHTEEEKIYRLSPWEIKINNDHWRN